jgi:methyl-accepting chemotaxis protein
LEKLHGTEAIVPLSGGRSIPVDLNFENFSQLISPNQDVVSDISNNITSGTEMLSPIQDVVSDISKNIKSGTFDLVEMLTPKISSMRDIGTAMNSVIAEVSKLSQSDPGPQSEIASAIASITELLSSKQEIKQSASEMSSVIEILNKMAESHEKSNQYLEDQVTALRQLYNAMA